MQTKHALDPDLEHSEDEYIVLFRDSDVAASETASGTKTRFEAETVVAKA